MRWKLVLCWALFFLVLGSTTVIVVEILQHLRERLEQSEKR